MVGGETEGAGGAGAWAKRGPWAFRQKAGSWEREWDPHWGRGWCGVGREPRCVAVSSDRFYP